MNIEDELSKYRHSIENNIFWEKPFLVRLIGLGISFIDFKGQPHKSDIIGYGNTVEEATKNALDQLKR